MIGPPESERAASRRHGSDPRSSDEQLGPQLNINSKQTDPAAQEPFGRAQGPFRDPATLANALGGRPSTSTTSAIPTRNRRKAALSNRPTIELRVGETERIVRNRPYRR